MTAWQWRWKIRQVYEHTSTRAPAEVSESAEPIAYDTCYLGHAKLHTWAGSRLDTPLVHAHVVGVPPAHGQVGRVEE